MQRLGRNVSGYAGEGIDYPHFEVEFARQAGERGWREEVFHEHGGVRISAWCRGPAQAARRVYISAGIHGDEPAGPLALLRLVRADHWPDQCEFLLCPALNPYGLAHNQRVNRDGLDLNRQYLKPVAPEVVSHCAWLTEQGRFDLALCLHEDWEAKGFYLYELNPDRLPAPARGRSGASR